VFCLFAAVMGTVPEQSHEVLVKAVKNLQRLSNPMTTLADPDPSVCQATLQNAFGGIQNDQNCITLITTLGATSLRNATTKAEVTAYISAICTNSCFRTILNAFKAIVTCYKANGIDAGDFNQTEAATTLMCLKNPVNDEYCMASFQDPGLRNISDGRRNFDNVSACYTFSQMGCCLTSIFMLAPSDDSGEHVKGFLRNTCGFVAPPPPCPLPGEAIRLVKATWRIKGVAYAYFQANRERVGAALRKDIATRLALDEGLIGFSGFRAGSLIADFSVRGSSDANTDAIAATLVTASAETGLAFPNVVAAVGTDGLDTAGATVGIDPAASSSSVQSYTAPGRASNVQPMFALVAALLAFAFFVRQ